MSHILETASVVVELSASAWTYRLQGSEKRYEFTAPMLDIDGHGATLSARLEESGEPTAISPGVVSRLFRGPVKGLDGLWLSMEFRVTDIDPTPSSQSANIVRYRYIIESDTERRLTKTDDCESMLYTSFSVGDGDVTEVRFAEFNEMVHSFTLSELLIAQKQFDNRDCLMGPMLVAEQAGGETLMVGYEHGSQAPDAFLTFNLDRDRTVTLGAVKGNYYHGQPIAPGKPYTSIWFEVGAVRGNTDQMASAYRDFVLRWMCPNAESRKPYIFYNTWAYQERNRWYNDQKFLSSMNQQRILAEIDAAHEMGVEVYVIDTGWYEKTGDWQVDLRRFPDGLKAVKAKLDGYGMKLGLWFDPLAAAQTSKMCLNHQDCRITTHGNEPVAHEVWETEPSFRMCLVSRYATAFADELIRLVHEVGVTYFKWDAIGQYGCSDPGHRHGTSAISEQERFDSYAFQIGPAMSSVVDRLCAACPEAIVDFDVTEGGRYVGLGFLASGKYFLINNGPYFQNYDVRSLDHIWSNIFVHPGPARAWICRTPLTLDKWIPSVLFLTHYLPDDPESSQWINIASLVLGQNGIWGDLLTVSTEGRQRFAGALDAYKSVREDVTTSALKLTGKVSGAPEVYEKINPATGRGLVSLFASAPGIYTYVTDVPVSSADTWTSHDVKIRLDDAGRAVIMTSFDGPGARLIVFR